MVGKLALGSESSRQTQNPERGRKPASGKSVRSKRFQRVVRPKTPRGDGNSKSSTTSAAAACSRSRQTQNPERGRKRPVDGGCVVRASVLRPKTPRGDGNIRTSSRQRRKSPVLRPKTPRGDGNPTMASKSAWVTDPGPQTQNPERGRKREEPSHLGLPPAGPQTQNPERGRKHSESHVLTADSHVLRPKTPRGDGNSKSSTTSAAAACSRSRQTQNPERGRKREEPSHLGLPPAGRQTQNPERGRKLVRHLCLIQVQCPVVRPKTPRGDGNLTARSFPASIR
ncbi:Uncharacterised protein [Mycobacterium tuberculosis]|nr:Uncharacterised protein [Mycobacterium tuberculosis]